MRERSKRLGEQKGVKKNNQFNDKLIINKDLTEMHMMDTLSNEENERFWSSQQSDEMNDSTTTSSVPTVNLLITHQTIIISRIKSQQELVDNLTRQLINALTHLKTLTSQL